MTSRSPTFAALVILASCRAGGSRAPESRAEPVGTAPEVSKPAATGPACAVDAHRLVGDHASVSLTYDGGVASFRLCVDARALHRAYVSAATADVAGPRTPWTMVMRDAAGEILAESWDVPLDSPSARSYALLGRGLDGRTVHEVVLELRSKVGDRPTTVHVTLLDPHD